MLWWGTYDCGKPRTRILRDGLREAGVESTEIHHDLWSAIEDKSQLRGAGRRLRLALRWLTGYPRLLWYYLRAPRHEVVVIGYPGHIDLLLLWPFARWRRASLLFDLFVPLHDTVVADRRMLGPRHPLAIALWLLEWLACRVADVVLVDTASNARYLSDTFAVDRGKFRVVPVGVEEELFVPEAASQARTDHELRVLFYGQFIPLHGIDTIVAAARLLKDQPVRWLIIGTGQEADRIAAMLREEPLPRLEWRRWVDYRQLREEIAGADLCLGIFGASRKAGAVIPNKVFQCLAAGKPIITRDSPAIRELLDPTAPGVVLVAPEDPRALADAALTFVQERPAGPLHRELLARISRRAIGERLREVLEAIHGERAAHG